MSKLLNENIPIDYIEETELRCSISSPKIDFKNVGLDIKIAPRKDTQQYTACFAVTFSLKIINANINTIIGDVTISEAASPNGSSVTPINQVTLQKKPIIPLK